MKNLSEVSSLRDLSADGGSSIIKKKLVRQNSLIQDQQGSSAALYTVPEEDVARSQIVQGDDEEDDIDLKELVIHYENMIQELRNNKTMELNIANQKI